jgi:hypothetical protein
MLHNEKNKHTNSPTQTLPNIHKKHHIIPKHPPFHKKPEALSTSLTPITIPFKFLLIHYISQNHTKNLNQPISIFLL